LGTFSGKILIGYHIGAISSDAHHDLRIMKDIRNDFAHDFSPLSFASEDIAKACGKLTLKTASVVPGSHLAEIMPPGPRGHFVGAFFNIVGQILMQFAFIPHERRLLEAHAADLFEKAKASFAARDFGQEQPPQA
jgi:hypothetical protein